MFKKLIISTLLLSTIVSWSFATFKMFQPVETIATNVLPMEEFISTTQMLNARSSDIANPSTIVFYYDNDVDSDYVINQVLSQVARELDLSSTYELPFAFKLVSNLDYVTNFKLKSEYGFSSFPALVVYEYDEEGTMYPVTSLEYDFEKPFTKQEIKTWLIENTDIVFE